MTAAGEASDSFPCFGSSCSAHVSGDGPRGSATLAVAAARRRLLGWHERFTRFSPGSELSLLNANPRPAVRVSPIMARFAAAVSEAAALTHGLVDATLLDELESAGYRGDREAGVPLERALVLAPHRSPAGARAGAPWRSLEVDPDEGIVRRPPGLRLDSGGLAKGLFADVLARKLAGHARFAVECAGDVRVGGTARAPRPVRVPSPFDADVLHTFELADAGIATSGISRRSWLDEHGGPAHHLLDPATGRPAFTGIVQTTAIAPTALEAEVRAKAALLSGPDAALEWLPHGGVVVLDDGAVEIVSPSLGLTVPGRSLLSNG